MTTMTVIATEGKAELDDLDQRVHLHGATFADYERLLEIRGERSVPRITYLLGELELMSPSARHEGVAERIAWLLGLWALEHGVELQPFGTTTWKEPRAERGAEADKSYVIGDDEKPRPDLVLEVVVTSGGLDKLEVYRGLGVPEVWFWRQGCFTVHVLRGERYEVAERSALLPGLDLDLVARVVERCPRQTRAGRLFQRLLRRR